MIEPVGELSIKHWQEEHVQHIQLSSAAEDFCLSFCSSAHSAHALFVAGQVQLLLSHSLQYLPQSRLPHILLNLVSLGTLVHKERHKEAL